MKIELSASSLFVILSIIMTEQGSQGFSSASEAARAAGSTTAASASATPEGEVPQLPEADPNANIPRINLGETIRFEEMGPVILNTDGTTRRIANWDNLTEQEKKVTWRRISKRNEERRKVLLKKQEQEEDLKNDDL